MKALTERQTVVLAAIAEYIRENGFSPTLREIGKLVGIRSTNGVNDHLLRLMAKGYLTPPSPTTGRGFAKTRSIQLTKRARAMFLLSSAEDRLSEIQTMFRNGLINIPSEAHAARFNALLFPQEAGDAR